PHRHPSRGANLRDRVGLPLLESPTPWTDWEIRNYPFRTSFVRDPHPNTVRAIRKTFELKRLSRPMFRHVDAVNHAQSVPWRINTDMIDVVRRFAGVVRDDRGRIIWRGNGDHVVGKSVDRKQVLRDCATAKLLVKHGNRFWVPISCDLRGRI